MVYDSAMKQSYSVAQLRSVLLYLSIGLLTLCALLGILAVLSQEVDWRILFTTFCAAIASLIAMSNISRLADNRIVIKILSIMSIILNAQWFTGMFVIQWNLYRFLSFCRPSVSTGSRYNRHYSDYSNYDYEGHVQTQICSDFLSITTKLTLTALIIALLITLSVKTLSYANKNSFIIGMKMMTVTCASLLSMACLSMVWFNVRDTSSTLRFLVVFGILTVFGLIVTPILVHLEKVQRYLQPTQPNTLVQNEQQLRHEIERQVRAQIAAEQQAAKAEEQAQVPPTASNEDGAMHDVQPD
jgi:membrane protein